VHGDDALGFYDTITNTYVTPGDPGCPSVTQAGVTYTRTPCIALVLPGQDFQFLLVVSNVGATAASRINMVDVLPVAGDTGVLLTGQQRGTQWNNAPILTAAPTVIGDSHVTAPEVAFSYTSGAQSSVCTNDLTFPPTSCPPGAWDPTFTAASTAFRAVATFPTGSHLPPGGSVIISVPLRAPVDPDSAQSLPIAWNSFAHTDFVDGSGQLLPQEPPKVGIAMPLGNLVITKQIGTPGPAGGVGPFTASYTCTVTPSGGTPVVVATGSGPFTVGAPLTVANLPASASCQVWESDAGGGVSDHPAANPATVTIPIGATITTAPDAAVTLTNTFPTTGGTGTGSGGTGTGSGGSGTGSGGSGTGSGGSGTGSGGSHPSQPTHSGSGNVLAQTGSDIVAMLAIGALIAAAGALLCLLARRRRPS
jgi:LPXTG-motif cell wall-anchored protein